MAHQVILRPRLNGWGRFLLGKARIGFYFARSALHQHLDIAMQPFQVLTSVDETVSAIASICRELNSKAWLFGSQARRQARSTSDIDVAVLSDDFDEIEERIESIDTIFPIDLVDLSLPHKKGIEDAWISIA